MPIARNCTNDTWGHLVTSRQSLIGSRSEAKSSEGDKKKPVKPASEHKEGQASEPAQNDGEGPGTGERGRVDCVQRTHCRLEVAY